jgi:tRNA threonylcarbamoyladenosine modification (KEOPS) complex  Pcc1 subunit
MYEKDILDGEVQVKICGIDVESVFEALRVELAQPQPEKGKVFLTKENNCLKLLIKSNNISGLRALTNSFLYLIYAASSTLETLQSLKG